MAMARPGLPPDLGRHPAGDHRNKARRPHRKRGAVEPGPVVQLVPPPRDEAEQTKPEHREAKRDHDAERPENYRHRRPLIAREILEAGQRGVGIMLEDQRTDLGHLDLIVDAPLGITDRKSTRELQSLMRISYA